MQPITNLLINSLRKAVKFVHRDFLELEMLQKNPIRNEEFCKRSYLRLKTLLCEELQKHTKYLFFPEDQFDPNNNYETVFLVNPIDSPNNFARSLPFFAVSITCLKQNQDVLTPVSTVIYFPVLNEVYYAERGRGAWVEKNDLGSNHKGLRLRVSDNDNLENCLTIIEDLKNNNFQEINNSRTFGSSCYAAMLLASGKADLIYLPLLNFTLYYSFDLFIKEAGGIVVDSSDKFIYSNRYITRELKKS
ncbi:MULTISPECIES: inositol monophosphatase [unclassified Rickettsia]|uniref:inositol monophosphatase family protein n=1 Tax=unclassified Rickettsia TaxID=114295 RepID=UPI003132B4BB